MSDDWGKRSRLMRRMCILAAVTLVTSGVSIIIGIAAVNSSGSKFPYNAGGGIIAGLPAFLLAFCPFYMVHEGNKSGDDSTTGCFDCCTILMVVWFSITILAIPIGFGLSGVYGISACTNEVEKAKVCQENADSKMAFSVVTLILTGILFILALAIFFTCCCNARTFGMPLLTSDYTYTYNTRPGTYGYSSRTSNSTSDRTNRGNILQELAIQETIAESRRLELRPRPATINEDNIGRTIRTPSAPISGSGTEEFDISGTTHPPFRSPTDGYSDAPPSYEEVMRKDRATTGTAV